MTYRTKVRVGAHVSIVGGVDQALHRAKKMGANCMQVFAGSPRTWRRLDLSGLDSQQLIKLQQELDVQPIFTHALYLVNLASPKKS